MLSKSHVVFPLELHMLDIVIAAYLRRKIRKINHPIENYIINNDEPPPFHLNYTPQFFQLAASNLPTDSAHSPLPLPRKVSANIQYYSQWLSALLYIPEASTVYARVCSSMFLGSVLNAGEYTENDEDRVAQQEAHLASAVHSNFTLAKQKSNPLSLAQTHQHYIYLLLEARTGSSDCSPQCLSSNIATT